VKHSGKRLKYHKIYFNKEFEIIIAEVTSGNYFWLCFYLNQSHRNKFISIELTKFLIHYLKGKHEIHWHYQLSTFTLLAKKYKWRVMDSDIYERCYAAFVTKATEDSLFSPLFISIIKHKVTFSKPKLMGYKSEKDKETILRQILTNASVSVSTNQNKNSRKN
jgi:hypothetical protein